MVCRKPFWRVLAALLPLLTLPQLPAEAVSPVSLDDGRGHAVTLQGPARRIVPLYAAFSGIVSALGAEETLVARTVADRDSARGSLPVVGTHMAPNIERIAALRPDIVLQLVGRKEAARQSDALRALGIPVLDLEMSSFEDLFAVTRLLGRLLDRKDEAEALCARWRTRLDAVAASLAGVAPVRVFYEVRYPNLLAAGRDSIVNDIIERAGGVNVVSQARKLVRFNEEALLVAAPEAYILQRGPMNPAPQPPEQRAHFQGLKAVRQGRVLVVEEERFARPGPASVDAVEELARWLHGKRDR